MNSPASPQRGTSRIFIRPSGTAWMLEDETRQMGGVFATLEAALAFARTERLNAGAIRIVMGGEENRTLHDVPTAGLAERPRPVSGLRAA